VNVDFVRERRGSFFAFQSYDSVFLFKTTMFKQLLLCLSSAIIFSACTNSKLEPNEAMRQKANAVMQSIMQQHDEDVYSSLAMPVKQAYSKEESIAYLINARANYGDISGYQLKNISPGARYARSTRMEMVRYWYATTNKLCPFSCFAQIDITLENGLPSVAGIEQIRFAEDHIPVELR
jgi:hypothetical protein